MNYSNMIEEKNLKKTFIIATLCSTLVGTFTSGINLYDTINNRRKQKKTDKAQNEKIQKLERQVKEAEERGRNNAQGGDRSRRAIQDGYWNGDGGGRGGGRRMIQDGDLGGSMDLSRAIILREYDRDFERLGPKFAQGDIITQNELQSQIITLQSSVIAILEDCVFQNRSPTKADIQALFHASESAREGAVGALRSQYQRMLANARPGMGAMRALPSSQRGDSPLTTFAGRRDPSPVGSIRSRASRTILPPAPQPPSPTPSRRSIVSAAAVGGTVAGATAAPSRPYLSRRASQSAPSLIETNPLFCRYSLDLQRDPSQPLAPAFRPGGSNTCPACNVRLSLETGRAWEICKEKCVKVVETPEYDDEIMEEQRFHLSNTFIIKNHTEEGELACTLCHKYREQDTVCTTIQAFVKHVWRVHSVEELEQDVDIKRVGWLEEEMEVKREMRYPESAVSVR